MILETVRVMAERVRPELQDVFRWEFTEVVADSPLHVSERDAEDQFRTWLKLWPAHCTVWIGDVFSSGKPEHRTHFRPIADWYQIGPVLGNYTCGSSFKPGSFSRCNENLNGHRFLVVESTRSQKTTWARCSRICGDGCATGCTASSIPPGSRCTAGWMRPATSGSRRG